MAINFIDALLFTVIALSVINGYRRGFVHGMLDLAGWALSLIAGLRYHQPVARWIGPRIDLWSEVWDQPIAFVLVALVTGVIVHAIGYWFLRRLPRRHSGAPDQSTLRCRAWFRKRIDNGSNPFRAAACGSSQ